MPRPTVAPQTYGQGVEMQQLDQAMPIPAYANQPTAQPQMESPSQQPGYTHEAAMAAAQQMQGQVGLLAQETTRPTEPITAGLSRGPGPGPSALGVQQGSPAGDILRRLSATTGDPSFAELARKAGV
jgi:hypothetical protein